jgi:hypothetical protein
MIASVCFGLIFFVVFGVGRFERAKRCDAINTLSNYSTQPVKKPQASDRGAPAASAARQSNVAVAATTSESSGVCEIKGNISAKGDKIY